MSNHNIEVLLEKSNKVSLGIRSRQTGITLKEYFLNQRERVKNIYRTQKTKLNEALAQASEIAKSSNKTANSSTSIKLINKAGKYEVKPFCSKGTTSIRVFANMKKIASEIYSIIKYRCSQIIKLCEEGIRKASAIIKGKSSQEEVTNAKAIKTDVVECNSLLNSSLSNMRDVFKAFHSVLK